NEISGFYIQDATGDSNALTSDGVFVYSTSAVTVGNTVRVVGTVDEYFALTELTTVTSVSDCGAGSAIQAMTLTLPITSTTVLEKYEGMLVTYPQTLYVTDNFTLGRYGQVDLASERLFQPTNVITPGLDATNLAAQNELKIITLDDAITTQNPDPVIYPAPQLTATNTLRSGDSVTGLTGVMHYGFSTYHIQRTITPNFVESNPRPSSPDAVGGTFRIASFNVLNYFNTIDQTGAQCYPSMAKSDCRGADSATEFTRQRDKIINAMLTLNPDVAGLMEIENDGYGATSAIQDLVNGLNAAAPNGTTYDFIDPGTPNLGGDAIAVGFIYRVETAEPVGAAVTKSDGAFSASNRQPLVQTFRELSTDGLVTVAVNHFKSKGSACSGDPDLGDGQGNCNLTRLAAANDLATWLATDPTGSGDADYLIIGDLNSYAKEDPITALKDVGYTDLINAYQGDHAYGYLFNGLAGYLDHALANSDLLSQVTGATEWHINSDEPISLDYNMEFKTANQQTLYYNDDPYRSSDHDPVLVGMTLVDSTPAPTVQLSSSVYTVTESIGTATITATLSAASAVTVTAQYTTTDGTADSSDYTVSNGTVTFTPGFTSTTFMVPVTNDTLDELNETLNITLSASSLGSPNSATLTIVDNDTSTVRFSSPTYSVNESAGTATITLTLSLPTSFPFTASYATSNGTAVAGSDYVTTTGTVT
ncbi:MAG: ExeM/NucH family extracellular endonuclease, partial [Ardenticatenales bacterium]|nr:ExeM/NucH family extracellular endonuclease [Ardenticatenales bacterium]